MPGQRQNETNEVEPMDPVALTLAVWLGLVVAVSGLVRMSEQASVQAALDEAMGQVATPMPDGRPLLQAMAFGA